VVDDVTGGVADGPAGGAPRIVHVVTSSQRRGAETFAVDLSAALDRRGFASEVVALTEGRDDTLPVPALGPTALGPTTLRALRRRTAGAAAVVAHGSRTLPATAIGLAGRPEPVVYRSIGDPAAWAGGTARRLRTRLLLGRTAAVTALWPAAADAVHDLYGVARDRLHVVPNGVPAARCPVPDEAARAAARRRLGLPPDVAVVAVIGALTPEKRVADAIDAIARVDGATLLVVGDGPERAALEARAAPLGARVVFTGVLPGPGEALAAADLVVTCSRTEGMPGVLVEAGLSGRATVATDVGGVAGVVRDGETGLLVAPGAVDALADAVRRALAERDELGAAARAHCLATFEIEPVADRWVDVLRSVGVPVPAPGAARPAGSHREERPLRVLMLTKGLGRGGTERLIVGAARLSDRRRVHLEVAYLLPWKDAFVADLEAVGTPVHLLDGPRASSVGWVRRLRRLVRERDIDLVHTHMPLPAAYARMAFPGRRPALVHTEHNMWGRYRAPTRWANAATYRRNARAIAVSDGVAGSIRSSVPVEVVVHGTDPRLVVRGDAARATARSELGLDPDALVVGTVGNFTAKKDQATLLRAVAALPDRGREVALVLVGTGPLEDDLRSLAGELGIAGRTRFPGSRDDVFALLPAFDVFALSSRFEGLPIALLEAMATGVAAVATRVGGIPEVITDGTDGALVDPGDVPALAAALDGLLGDDAARAALAERGRLRAGSFDLANAVRRTEAIYRAAAGRPEVDIDGSSTYPVPDGVTRADAGRDRNGT